MKNNIKLLDAALRYAERGWRVHPLNGKKPRLKNWPEIKKEYGSGMCNITRCCTDVCPENINITDNGIIPLKERVVDRYYDPIMWLKNKVFGK